MSHKFIRTTCFDLTLTIIRSLRAKMYYMQHSCHNTQWDHIGFNIDKYNDFKIVKDGSCIKIGHFWKLIGNYF
jgi:hypothetical protein